MVDTVSREIERKAFINHSNYLAVIGWIMQQILNLKLAVALFSLHCVGNHAHCKAHICIHNTHMYGGILNTTHSVYLIVINVLHFPLSVFFSRPFSRRFTSPFISTLHIDTHSIVLKSLCVSFTILIDVENSSYTTHESYEFVFLN